MLSREEFLLSLLALSWIGGFLPLWLGKVQWRWWQCVGLALVLSVFVRGALNFVDSVALLIATDDVLRPIPRAQLYDLAWVHFRNNLLIPIVGLLLIYDAPPGAIPEVARHVGAGSRFGARRDLDHGLALFLAVALAYAAAIAFLSAAPSLQSDGDESQVWMNVTPDVVLLLALVSGVGEEFAYRGILLGALARVMPWWWAAFAQAALFGLVHAGYGTWVHVIGPFLFGLGMAVVARGLGVVPAMVLHGGINATIFAIAAAPAHPSALAIPIALVAASLYAMWRVRLAPVRHVWAALRPEPEARLTVHASLETEPGQKP